MGELRIPSIASHLQIDRIKMNHEELAKQLSISPDDAETLVVDIMPILKRKFELIMRRQSSANPNDEKLILTVLEQELPNILNNYALPELATNQKVVRSIAKSLAPKLTNKQADQIARELLGPEEMSLVEELARQLGIRAVHANEFKTKVIPKIKKYTLTLFRKKLETGDSIDTTDGFTQFVIDNVFIDEFENHPFIRSNTDADNKAILLPQAKDIAVKMIAAWAKEASAIVR
jgi:hypothetical protein